MATVLYCLAETVRRLAILVQPVMPTSMDAMLGLLAVPTEARSFAHLSDAHRLTPGTPLPPPVGVFPRFVEPEDPSGPAIG